MAQQAQVVASGKAQVTRRNPCSNAVVQHGTACKTGYYRADVLFAASRHSTAAECQLPGRQHLCNCIAADCWS